jgi:hypothetical protein
VFGVVYRLQSCIILRTTYYGVRSTKRKERKSRPFAFAHLLKGVRGRAGAQEHKTTDLKEVSTLCKRLRLVPLNFTIQKEDSPSHQNIGKCMKY